MGDLIAGLKADLSRMRNLSIALLKAPTPDLSASVQSLLAHIHSDISLCTFHTVRTYQDKVFAIKQLRTDLAEAKSKLRKHSETLVNAYYSLETVCESTEQHLKETQSRRSAKLPDIIAFGQRLSMASSAPLHWEDGQKFPSSFHCPFPTTEDDIRVSLLFPSEAKNRLPKPEIRVGQYGDDYVELVMYCVDSEALIKYTLDQSIPTEFIGQEVKGPIQFDKEAEFTVKAVAFKRGFLESEVTVFTLGMDIQPPAPTTLLDRVQHSAPEGFLDLGFGGTPPSSSRYSDEDDYKSPSLR